MNTSTTKITILYKISNSGPDAKYYNSFEIPFANCIKLATVKQSCVALRYLNHAGAEGYHWRIRMEDKNNITTKKYSWWDIIDEHARLPLFNTSLTELGRILEIPKVCYPTSDGFVTKGAMRSLGKVMNKVASTVDVNYSSQVDTSHQLYIIVFKLVDMIKVYNSFLMRNMNYPAIMNKHEISRSVNRNSNICLAKYSSQNKRTTTSCSPIGTSTNAYQDKSYSELPQIKPFVRPKILSEVNKKPLMDLEPDSNANFSKGNSSHHFTSSLCVTRVQNLKMKYEKNKNLQNRVWDDIDERWVVIGEKKNSSNKSGKHLSKSYFKGISLDTSSAIGKSTQVAAAIHFRVNHMREAQKRAVMEIREREVLKRNNEASEDAVRLRLEPKIREWCEEHGKKKQLRALLASLHTILWTEANWKPVNLGDILDKRKCKLCFHKAVRVVHPDKTIALCPVNRFLAKRIFDALSQANAAFDV